MKYTLNVMLLLLGLLFSCKHNTSIEVNKPCTGVPDTVSFSAHILPIFNASCSLAGCHSGSTPTGNLNLEAAVAYAQLTKPGKGYIDTINPPISLLYAQMNSVSNPMPQSGKLDQCTVDLVLKWITQKAKNN